MNKISLIIA